MQWFMQEYEQKLKEFRANEHNIVGVKARAMPSMHYDGLAVLANKIASTLGPEYEWELMGPFGVRASCSLWFVKSGENILTDGGYDIEICPRKDSDGIAAFQLACGQRDFAGNPTGSFPMPETFEETLCFLKHCNPATPENLESVSIATVSIPPTDLYILKDLLSMTKGQAIEKYKMDQPELAAKLDRGEDTTYHFQFDDGMQLSLNFGAHKVSDEIYLYACLYDKNHVLDVLSRKHELEYNQKHSLNHVLQMCGEKKEHIDIEQPNKIINRVNNAEPER